MARAWTGRGIAWVLAALCLAAGAARAADDTDWRARALALNDITGEKPIEGQIEALVQDPPTAKKLIAAAVPLAKKDKPDLNYNAAYILCETAIRLKDAKSAETFYHVCKDEAMRLLSVRKLGHCYAFFAYITELLNREKKYDAVTALSQDLLEALKKAPVRNEARETVLRTMIRSLAHQGKTDVAMKMVDSLLKANPGDWENHELKGWLQRQTGQLQAAAKTYEDLIRRVGKAPELNKRQQGLLVEELRYLLSGVYVDLNAIDKATEHLQALLKDHPNDPAYNNDLGYIWADHDMRLDDAERLIRKAIAEDLKKKQKKGDGDAEAEGDKDKENAAYLDSLGWVLYKQKKYKEAEPVLLKAIQDKEGQHVEIFDHLGELYRALGDRDKAVKYWKKAAEVAGPDKKEQERKAAVERKIKAAEDGQPADTRSGRR